MYTLLPNSRWLHHTALRYFQRLQLGAYMWRKGLKWVKTGSNWAHFTCLCTWDGSGSLLQKRVFDPFFSHFSTQNGPFSTHLAFNCGPKRVTTGSKWAKNTCWSIPNGLGPLLERRIFDSFSAHYWSQNGPFSRHFGIFPRPKRATTGSKWAKNTCLSIPNCPRSLFEKRVFEPFLIPKRPMFHAFWDFPWPKNTSPRAQNGLKTLLPASPVV